MEHSEESNDMVFNHPDIECVDQIIRKSKRVNSAKSQKKLGKENEVENITEKKLSNEDGLKKRKRDQEIKNPKEKTKDKLTKEEKQKRKEENEKLKAEQLEERRLAKEEKEKRKEEYEKLKAQRLEERRLAEEEKEKRREENAQRLEQRRLAEEEKEKRKEEFEQLKALRLEEKRLAEEEKKRRKEENEQLKVLQLEEKKQRQEEKIQRKIEIERLKEEHKQRRLEEKRIAEENRIRMLEEKKLLEEEALKKRKEKALKGMKYLLNVSTKYSDFIKEKLTTNTKRSTSGRPLQERNKFQPTIRDMKEAANVDDKKTVHKAISDVAKQLKYFEGGKLREYQIEGVQWMVNLFDNGINGILADEMGLGKTVQVIAMLAHLLQRKIPGPYLIVAPLSTLPNWELEFTRFAPQIPVITFQGNEKERKQIVSKVKRRYSIGNFETGPVVLTTYQVPMLERNFLDRFQWQYIIIDEGHRVKNHESKLSQTLRSFNSSNRLLLTGTPIQNNITELWALLNFLMPHIFNHVDTFASLLMLEDMQDENKLIEQEEKTNFLSTLHQVLEPFVLRRLKKDVLTDLVPKKELNIYCPLTKLQHDMYNYVIDRNFEMLTGKEEAPLEPRRKKKRICYYQVEDEDDDSFSDQEEEENEKGFSTEARRVSNRIEKNQVEFIVRLTMANPMIMFKKIVDHPYLVHFPLDPNSKQKALLINEDLILTSGKMMVLDQVLARLKRDGHKVLIFSTLVMTLDLVEEALIMRDYQYCRLDGGMNMDKRKGNIENFNADPDVFAFLLSTRSGGLGLNLTGADTVIFFDRDWNPQMDIQAQDRCHRIGQTKPVMVYTLIAKNTIDDLVIKKGFQKRLLEKIVIKDGKFQTTNSSDVRKVEEELRGLRDALTEVATNFDNLTIPEHELDKLLDRSELWAQIKAQKENNKC